MSGLRYVRSPSVAGAELVRAVQSIFGVEHSLFQPPSMERKTINSSPVWLRQEITLGLEVTRQELVP